MAIKSNVGLGIVNITSPGDILALSISEPVERVSIESFSVHHDGVSVSAIKLSVFVSPDTTSANGDRVAEYSVPVDGSVDIIELIGQGLSSSQNVVVTAVTSGLNSQITVTEYTAGS